MEVSFTIFFSTEQRTVVVTREFSLTVNIFNPIKYTLPFRLSLYQQAVGRPAPQRHSEAVLASQHSLR